MTQAAMRYDLLSKNPVLAVQIPRAKVINKTRKKPHLTPEEFEQLLQLVSEKYATMIYIAVFSGLRISELIGLKWNDVHSSSLTVDERYCRGDGQECPDPSPEAFIFPNARKRNGAKRNGFIRTDNYRARVLKKVAESLCLPKLNFQVLRRTMATLAQTKGGIKDVQGVLGHSKADTTVNVYMQEIEVGVKQTLGAIYSELTTPEVAGGS